MKKITRISTLAVIALCAAAMLQPAYAVCGSARLFGSGSSYLYTPGCGYNGCENQGSLSSMTDAATGAFWAIGSGSPAVGPGNDNGSFPFLSGFYPTPAGWGTFYPGYPVYIDSTWAADGAIDNCVDASPDKCMAILVMDNDANTGAGAFALLTAEPDALGNYSFDKGGPVNLVTIDKLSIITSVRNLDGTGVTVGVDGIALSDVESGLYLDENCAQPGPLGDLIAGYQVFTREVPRGDPAPDNDAANWTPVGDVVMMGAPTTASLSCPGSPTVDKYVTAGLVFDSAFSNVLLSGNSTRIECGTTLAEPEEEIERKPRNRETPRSRSRGR